MNTITDRVTVVQIAHGDNNHDYKDNYDGKQSEIDNKHNILQM